MRARAGPSEPPGTQLGFRERRLSLPPLPEFGDKMQQFGVSLPNLGPFFVFGANRTYLVYLRASCNFESVKNCERMQVVTIKCCFLLYAFPTQGCVVELTSDC